MDRDSDERDPGPSVSIDAVDPVLAEVSIPTGAGGREPMLPDSSSASLPLISLPDLASSCVNLAEGKDDRVRGGSWRSMDVAGLTHIPADSELLGISRFPVLPGVPDTPGIKGANPCLGEARGEDVNGEYWELVTWSNMGGPAGEISDTEPVLGLLPTSSLLLAPSIPPVLADKCKEGGPIP